MKIAKKSFGLVCLLVISLLLVPITSYASTVSLSKPATELKLQNTSLILKRDPAFLKNIGKQVTIEGTYYDGSIPMIIDDINRVYADTPLPPESYIPLTNALPSLKTGDHVKLTGILEKPLSTLPNLRKESAVLRVNSDKQIQLINKSTLLLPAKMKLDLSKIIIHPELFAQSYAVLIAGGWSPADNHIRYWNDLSWMYSLLVAKGYPKSHIIVLYADGVAKDTSMPVNYAATKANISAVFTDLAGKVNKSDTVYIMTNDHGTQLTNGTGLCLWNYTVISDNEFAVEVNKIANYKDIVIQMKQCFSGGFVTPLTKPNRVVMSSCSANQVSYSTSDLQHGEFTYWYISALSGAMSADANKDGKTSILEAYNFARSHDRANEIPQFEGNGFTPFIIGNVPESGEGAIAAKLFL